MMFFELLAAILAGVALGTFTGLVPGVHVNLVAAVILSASATLLQLFAPLPVAAAIMAMSITHVFIDFIPSIFLGAPSDATALAVLPGHRMLLEGRGYEAVLLSALGGFMGIMLIMLLLPLLLVSVKWVFGLVSPHIGVLLAMIALVNVLGEKKFHEKFLSFAVFSMAGLLGVLALGIPNMQQPLLPLLSGLFGVSTMIASTISGVSPPIQLSETNAIRKMQAAKSVAAGALSGGLVGILPALGPAQAAMLARQLIRSENKRNYLVTLGAVSTSSMLFGLVTLFAIDKARNGSIAMLSEIVSVEGAEFLILAMVAMVAGAFSLPLSAFLGKLFAQNIYRISYQKAAFAVIGIILLLTLHFSQMTGVIVLATGTAIGFFTIEKKVARHNLMGCLMLPVILYYF